MPQEPRDARVTQFRRMAALVTHVEVPHPLEKEAALQMHPFWQRKRARRELEEQWAAVELRAATDVLQLVDGFSEAVRALTGGLDRLHLLGRVRIQGLVDDERRRLASAHSSLVEARSAMERRDFEGCGRAVRDADRELWALGGELSIGLNEELQTAAYSRELRQSLAENQAQRKQARRHVDAVRRSEGSPEALRASVDAYLLTARNFELLAQALGETAAQSAPRLARIGTENELRVIPPQELERLDEVGGLDQVKDLIRRTLGLQLERPDEAARYGVAAGGVLFYGPPGTGKTMLARAIAGEYGLRYLRMAPAAIASPYPHETTKNLTRVFQLASQSAPCVLFLDEIDSLAAARMGLPSAEHREVVSQLLTLLEEYRGIKGLVIVAATNALELLDPALREGRFDVKIPVPMPDAAARYEILRLHLQRRSERVAWDDVALDEVAQRAAGRSGAALGVLVATAAEIAMRAGKPIGQAELIAAIGERSGRDRMTLEVPVRWSDVVLPDGLAKRLREILRVVQRPELAESVGIEPPRGVLLYGPPGTGKTTIAKAMATETRASFYEFSAADLLSKWVGESEERVAKVFARARDTSPSIVFIDEIDSMLRRRTSSSVSPWEERVVSQFLREIDGMQSRQGVFLVGATNRLDIIDEAIVERRLVPLEVPLPDLAGRRRLLQLLFANVRLAGDVDLDRIARLTDGMSGADLKHLRDDAGYKALSRADDDGLAAGVEVSAEDIEQSVEVRCLPVIPE